MLYLDTSVVLAALTPELHSRAASQFLETAAAPLAISTWTITELHSALGLKIRSGQLSRQQSETVLGVFEQSLAPALQLLTNEGQDFRNANACLRGWLTALRAGDALHLATAAGRGATLCSFDRVLVAAADQLGFGARLLSG